MKKFVITAFWALLSAAASEAGVMTITMTSDPGDWVGRGESYSLNYDTALGDSIRTKRVTWNKLPRGIEISAEHRSDSASQSHNMDVWLSSGGMDFVPGVYWDAEEYYFPSPGHPGMSVRRNSFGCNDVAGSFAISEFVGSGSRLYKASGTFEQYCFGITAGLRGSFTYVANTGAVFEVEDAAGTQLTTNKLINFPATGPGQRDTIEFVVLSSGAQPVSLSALVDPPGSYSLADFPAGPLSCGESIRLAVTLAPASKGIRNSTLRISSDQSAGIPFTLNLTGGALTRYEEWSKRFFYVLDESGDRSPLADPDRDGLPNLMEFAMYGHPMVPYQYQNSMQIEGGAWSYTFQRSKAAMEDVTLTPETSESPAGPWIPVDGGMETILQDLGTAASNGHQILKLTIPLSASGRCFLRFKVSMR